MEKPSLKEEKLNDKLTICLRPPDEKCHTVNWWVRLEKGYGIEYYIVTHAKTREEALLQTINHFMEVADDYNSTCRELSEKLGD
jgi:hypothetical protein